MRDNVTATECRGWLMRIHTCVKEKRRRFKYKLWHFNLSVTQWYFCWRMLNIWLLLIISRWIMVWNKAVFCMEVVIYKRLQIWRHNHVIGHNEYLICTLSESTVPWVYSLQFLFKSTYQSWRYERKCEWVFFSEHSVYEYAIARMWITCDYVSVSSRAASFKRPLLSVDVSVCVSVCPQLWCYM